MTNCTGKRCPIQVGKIDPITCEAYKDCQWATRPMTNADRIRAMTDKEMAGWMNYLFPALAYEWLLDWLKQEAKEAE